MQPATRSEITSALARGTLRFLAQLGYFGLLEMPLGNQRRADVMAVGRDGEIWIVETKSGPADFRADRKWPDYEPYCDALYFAVAPDFPLDILPEGPGLIVADQHGGALIRRAPIGKLAPARRKALLIAFGRLAAARLAGRPDPDPALDL